MAVIAMLGPAARAGASDRILRAEITVAAPVDAVELAAR